jgi:AcrR family transcriptional regulator
MNERSFIKGDLMSDTEPQTRGEVTREAILDAAEGLILSQGYHGTSMRQIADGAGLAVGAIYNHFDGKAAVFHALLERHQPYSGVVARLADLQGESAEELLLEAARLIIEQGLVDPDFIRLAFIDLQEFGGDTVFQLATHMIHGLVAFFGPLYATGQLREDLPMPVLVRSFAGLVIFYVLSEVIGFSDGAPRAELPVSFEGEIDWLDGMVSIFLHGAEGGGDA